MANQKSFAKRRGKDNGKHFVRIVALTIALFVVISILASIVFPFFAEGARDRYLLEMRVPDAFSGAEVRTTFFYTNRTGQTLDRMVFRIDMNAYRRVITTPVEYEELNDAYPAGFYPGGVELYSVQVNGQDADYGVIGDGEEFLRVACALQPGQSAEFSFTYEVVLPMGKTIAGAGTDEMRFVGFYPQAVRYDADAKEYLLIESTPIRETTFAEACDYHVTIEAPPQYELIAPGDIGKENVSGNVTWTVNAENVREFSLSLHRAVRKGTDQTPSGTEISVYTANRSAEKRVLTVAEEAVSLYETWFGAYPYRRLNIAEADLLFPSVSDGMVMLPKSYFGGDDKVRMERELAFLIGKQWFGCLVDNNPDAEPWLDDAVANYVSLLYYESIYGHDAFARQINSEVVDALKITIPGGVAVNSSSGYFASRQEYETVMLHRGAAVMHNLRELLGEDAFLASLGTYVENGAGKAPGFADFIQAIEQVTGRDLTDYLLDSLNNIGDYANQSMERFVE